jgi:hypothetical protein
MALIDPLTTAQVEGKRSELAVPTDGWLDLQERPEDDRVDDQRRQGIQRGPHPTQDALLVLDLELALGEVLDDAAVIPRLSYGGEHSDVLVRMIASR